MIEIPYLQVADIRLPPDVERLRDLAYNLRWTWNPKARRLFAAIDRGDWARYRNPVQLLLNVKPDHWEGLFQDEAFMGAYAAAERSLARYMGATDTWFAKRVGEWKHGPIAYFSMEYGLHASLPIYSGGLGVLSGDHCKSASDLGLPFVAVGLLYRLGYFRQALDADGIQQHGYPETDFIRSPLRPVLEGGRELVVEVPLPGRTVAVKPWLAQVGRVPLLLLDTDIAANDPADRPITNVLYVRGREARLSQEAVLGIGGARVLAALGLEPAVWHINEGHSSLLQLERLRVARDGGAAWDEALDAIRERTAFTTHTPVPAGNEQFDRGLARVYLDIWERDFGFDTAEVLRLGEADHGEPGQPLNLTALAIKTAAYVNGVSRLNSEVGDRMWRHLRPDVESGEKLVDDVTNGVHLPTWMGPELRDLISRTLGSDWLETTLDPATWDAVADLPARGLWEAHQAHKARLGRFARSRLREQLARHGRPRSELQETADFLAPDVLTIGFARRFATYKRAGLLFGDLHRLRALVNHRERPIQIVLAGKAHPADRPGQELIKHIFSLSREHGFRGRVIFLENYDMRIGSMMVQGCDVWLNTPRRPLEACGTSGQKAAINGVLNFSILDGWWPEAFDGTNGWAIGDDSEHAEAWRQDEVDGTSLYKVLEEEIAPRFYDRRDGEPPAEWVETMKRSIASVGALFSSHRMVRDYAEKAYLPLVR